MLKFKEDQISWSNRNEYFYEAVEECVRYKQSMVSAGEISQTTADKYSVLAQNHIIPYFEKTGLKIRDIASEDIKNYYLFLLRKKVNGKQMKITSVYEHAIIIRQTFELLIEKHMVTNNVAKGVKVTQKKSTKKMFKGSFYDADEIKQLLIGAHGDPLYPIIYLTLYYGLRRGEVLGLKWSAIDFKRKLLKINHTVVKLKTCIRQDKAKTEASLRNYPLLDDVAQLLQNLRSVQESQKKRCDDSYVDNDYVFKWENGKPFSTEYVSKHFSVLLKHLDMRHIRFHDLRHTCVSFLYDKGWALKDIQEWVGHANSETTANIYLHIDKERKKRMAYSLSGEFQYNKTTLDVNYDGGNAHTK